MKKPVTGTAFTAEPRTRSKSRPEPRLPKFRPAVAKRRFSWDAPTCLDMFSGFGGLTQAAVMAGFEDIVSANHKEYKILVHEANFPESEHWICNLSDPESSDYRSAVDLPYADLLIAGVTCTNHTIANTKRAYLEGLSLFDLDDPDFEDRATRSERDRMTATCVLQYAGKHHPKLMLIECTTELQSWGYALPNRPKVGDGTSFKWWLAEISKLGYRFKILYLNSMFFGVPQSRDRIYIVFWDEKIPDPDLDHRPISQCVKCGTVEGVWTWKTGIPPTGQVRYGVQYNYRCPSCRREVMPAYTPSLYALDLSNLGTRIGDRKTPLAAATMARAERCRQRFGDFPAVMLPITRRGDTASSGQTPLDPLRTQTGQQETALLSGMVMPAKAAHGADKGMTEALQTQTGQQEQALLTAPVIMQTANGYEHPGSTCRSRGADEPLWTQPGSSAVGLLQPPQALGVVNWQGAPRGVDEELPTQGGSETLGLLSARVLPNRTNGTSRDASEPMETLVGNAGSGGLGILSTGVVPYRRHTTPATAAEPLPTQTADQIPGLITAAGRVQCNGSIDEAGYRAYPLDRPLGTVVGSATTQGLLFSGWYKSNGSTGNETAPHPVLDPFNTLTAHDTTTVLTAEWRDMLADLALEDCYFRMLGPHEVGRGCGFDVDFADHKGSFVVWGSARDQVDGFGNAVSPPTGWWICDRLRRALHGEQVAA